MLKMETIKMQKITAEAKEKIKNEQGLDFSNDSIEVDFEATPCEIVDHCNN